MYEMNCAELVAPPKYTTSSPSPEYSSSPLLGEQSLYYASSSRSRTPPTDTFVTSKHGVSLALTEQERDVVTPVYDGLSPIEGFVTLQNRERISELLVKLEGRLETSITGSSSVTGTTALSKTTTIICETRSLWQSDQSQCDSAPPGMIPFSLNIPKTFKDDEGNERFLPPSHKYRFAETTGMISKAKYTLSVIMVSKRPSNSFSALFRPKTKRIKSKIIYVPRRRPHLPVLSNPELFDAIKCSPEEWHQCLSVLERRTAPNQILSPDYDLHVNFFIPAVRIFGLHDSIPFHIQITGSRQAVRSLLDEDPSRSVPTENVYVKVALHRSVCVEIHGSKWWRTDVIGETTVHSIPPPLDTPPSKRTHSLDYAGSVQINPSRNIQFGGFHAGRTIVQDYIMLCIKPSPKCPQKSLWLPLQKPVSIRFVTDSWREGISNTGLV